jgi:hypothetical protein
MGGEKFGVAACCLVILALASEPAADGRDDSAAVMQSRYCDRYLPVSTQNPFGYRLRGDRCEGIYVKPVSATPLTVASFGQLNAPQLPASGGVLLVEWTADSGNVRLRANSLKSKTYYRMDSLQPAAARSYRWPTDVLAALRLTMKDIGVVAWTEQKVAGKVREVYLPIRIGQPPAAQETAYELVLVPGDELKEVFITLSKVDAGGQIVQVSAPKSLNYGFYPAGRGIRIPIEPLPHPGTYVVQIGATLRGGGAISDELWIRSGK